MENETKPCTSYDSTALAFYPTPSYWKMLYYAESSSFSASYTIRPKVGEHLTTPVCACWTSLPRFSPSITSYTILWRLFLDFVAWLQGFLLIQLNKHWWSQALMSAEETWGTISIPVHPKDVQWSWDQGTVETIQIISHQPWQTTGLLSSELGITHYKVTEF